MAANLLFNAAKHGCRGLSNVFLRPNINISKYAGQQVRNMGGQRTMVLKPTRYEYDQWRDHLKFHFAIHLIPMGFLITVINIRRGRCELVDIPEDYTPKHWEYYRHPISKWFARYVFYSPEETYERHLHLVNRENEKRLLRRLETKFRQLSKQRGDYKSWYYLPTDTHPTFTSYQLYDTASRDDCAK